MSGSSVGTREKRWPGLDVTAAQWGRVWNYLLGGKDHFAADRATGDLIAEACPDISRLAGLQRGFLSRAVGFLAREAGIRQFIHIGTGLPVTDSTDEVARAVAPQSRVVYVDSDPMALAHARALFTSTPGGAIAYVDADVRDTDTILAGAASILDLSRPAALVMFAVLGQVPDSDDPHALVRRLMSALPSGSYLALCDGTDASPALAQAVAAYNRNAAGSYHLRGGRQIAAFFDGLVLVPPGVVSATQWHADFTELTEDAIACGVGFKP
jgi:hypothetical protein